MTPAANPTSDLIVDVELKRWLEPERPAETVGGGVAFLALVALAIVLLALAIALVS